MTRREFLRDTGAAAALAGLTSAAEAAARTGAVHIAPFRFDVTPPLGHSCCGGWIKPVEAYDDPLEAIGFVLLGAGAPIVICAVDWTGILNEAHVAWRRALAEAAGTAEDRVAVHCVHQHNAPLVCFDAERFVSTQKDLPRVFDRDFHARCLDAARSAVVDAVKRARPVSHVAHGQAQVEQVASNRRLARDASGRVTKMRGSASRDAALVAMPEGLIDPWLRTVAFYEGDRKIVACHYYATHPMSYYADGRVSSDFCGLARKWRQQDDPGCTQIYFTGCAGNIAAGKYNDGAPAARERLTERMYRALVASESSLRRESLGSVSWRTETVMPGVNPALGNGALRELIDKQRDALVVRIRPAFKLAWAERCARQQPLGIAALKLNQLALLHLPAEPFVELQLAAQAMRKELQVMTAAYGDGGPWYIPPRAEFPAGGYEVEHAFGGAECDELLSGAIRRLLS